MELIKSRKNLEDALESCEGCVIYGAGLAGTCMIQYLIRERLMSKVICIAVQNKERNPAAIMGIPVCEFRELECYKEKYLFLIATLEHLQKNIIADLKKSGCIRVSAISDLFYANMREEINDFTPDILCALQKGFANVYDNFILLHRKIDSRTEEMQEKLLEELTYKIEEQNEVSCVNTKAFAKYKNCHRGRDVVIAATGPTLNDYEPVKDAVHIGVNTAYKNPRLSLDYLFVQDGKPAFLKEKYKGLADVPCKVFMGRILKSCPVEEIEFPEQYRLGENVSNYFLDHIGPTKKIYTDICNHPVSGWKTVTFSALHFALYTYPRRIYLVGCDVTPVGYYDGTIDKDCLIDQDMAGVLKEGYRLLKEFAQLHYPETEIIAVNPIGLKGMFQEVYTKRN